MKKNIFYMIACGVMVLAAAACSKEQANNEPQEEPAGLITESFSAQKENEATKVTMNSRREFGWSTADKAAFSIYNDGTSSYDFVESDFYGTPIANKFTVSYTGTRQGYAVIPSTFAKSLSADGTTLTVTYPSSYDISADVDAGTYDNADGAHFIPFPMVAKSQPGEPSLIFNSIGALVKVVVSHVPAGTKNLYVTFNQTVTGDFVVSELTTPTRFVSVSDTSTPSTVTVKISESGLAAEQTITLYIPVPTTAAALKIASSSATKATVARNYGYQFSCEAISRVDASTDFFLHSGTDFDVMFAPGNLYAYNEGGVVKYGLRSKYEQVITTMGANSNDPHQNGVAPVPSVSAPGQYQDIFTWDEVYKIFTGESTVPSGPVDFGASRKITVDGVEYYMMNRLRFADIANLRGHGGTRLKANTIEVAGLTGAIQAAVQIDLTGSPYEGYAMYKSLDLLLNNDLVFGRFFFPDGYVDMTDLASSRTISGDEVDARNWTTIKYSAYKAMVDAGAVFLVNGGAYDAAQGKYVSANQSGLPYWCRQSDTAGKAFRITGSRQDLITISEYDRNAYYRSVRPTRDSTMIP